MTPIPRAAERILRDGTLCYLGAPSSLGPHVTPVVFVLDGGRLWGTTGRNTTKAKLWRRDPQAGGLVGHRGRWLTFRGPVTLYDALDPGTWPVSLWRGPRVASASVRFSMKNARFFAGYARDVTRVPLAWTPPGRVIFSVELEAGAVLGEETIVDRWGSWGEDVESLDAFRPTTASLRLQGLPAEMEPLLQRGGTATLGLRGSRSPVVLPARWKRSAGAFFATLPSDHLALSAARAEENASLVIDRASAWRAAKMKGVLLRGPSSTYVVRELRSGASQLARGTGKLNDEDVAVRLRPRSAVWWSGWSSGTLRIK